MALRVDNSYGIPNWGPVQTGGGNVLPKPPVTQVPSPNRDRRPGGLSDISAIVLHHTSGGTLSSVSTYFQNDESDVSSHYVIGKDGRITQPVPDGYRAWHAGKSSFQGRDDVNDFSLGIELVNEGDGRDPFTDAQYSSLVRLVAWMCQTYGIPLDRITGHKDVALPAGRKADPAENFDWNRVRAEVKALLAGQTAPAAAPSPSPSTQVEPSADRFEPTATPAARPAAPAGGASTVIVRNGDFLSKIAQERLGNSNRWREIYDLNRDIIKDPNLIYPGQVLRMPAAASQPQQPAPQPVVQPQPAPRPVVQPQPQPWPQQPAPQPVVQPQPQPWPQQPAPPHRRGGAPSRPPTWPPGRSTLSR